LSSREKPPDFSFSFFHLILLFTPYGPQLRFFPPFLQAPRSPLLLLAFIQASLQLLYVSLSLLLAFFHLFFSTSFVERIVGRDVGPRSFPHGPFSRSPLYGRSAFKKDPRPIVDDHFSGTLGAVFFPRLLSRKGIIRFRFPHLGQSLMFGDIFFLRESSVSSPRLYTKARGPPQSPSPFHPGIPPVFE